MLGRNLSSIRATTAGECWRDSTDLSSAAIPSAKSQSHHPPPPTTSYNTTGSPRVYYHYLPLPLPLLHPPRLAVLVFLSACPPLLFLPPYAAVSVVRQP